MKIQSEISEFFKKERAIILVLVTLFVLLSIAAVIYLNGERRRSRILMEYQIERAASGLFESYRDGASIQDETYERIVGFGVYSHNGAAVLAVGEAPHTLQVKPSIDVTPIYTNDNRSATISMVRPIGMVPLGGVGGMMSRRPNNMAILFVRIQADGFFAKQSLLIAAYPIIPLIVAILLYLVGRLYYRNWSYRKKIESQQNLVYLGEASRTLTHEIRNPLSAIQLQTGILRKLLPNQRTENLDVIDEEVVRLSNLTNRIRDFVKNPIGNPIQIDVIDLVHELVALYSWNLRIDADRDEYVVHFDRDRFRSVLENLLRNAVEASDADAEIVLKLEKQRARLRISILDRGKGFPDANMNQLFDPFFTMKESGSGIGLAISKRFVEAAGGSLQLRPRKDGGTEALLVLNSSNADGSK